MRSSTCCVNRFHVLERKSSIFKRRLQKKEGVPLRAPLQWQLTNPQNEKGQMPQVTLTRPEYYSIVIAIATLPSNFFDFRRFTARGMT